VEIGKDGKNVSPVVQAIRECEKRTTGEIRVHLSHRLLDKDPFARASSLFESFGMRKTRHRNAVLIYLNLKRRKFAVVCDEGLQQQIHPKFWDTLASNLKEDLLSTHFENALAMAVWSVGSALKKHFPVDV
jgi:uncharacterized membrane protein